MKVWVWNFLAVDEARSPIKKMVDEELQKLSTIVEQTCLAEQTWQNCEHCYKCWTEETNLCKFADKGRDLADAIKQFDMLVCIAENVDEQLPSTLKSAFNRLLPNLIERKFSHPQLLFCIIGTSSWSEQASGGENAQAGKQIIEQELWQKLARLGIDYRFAGTHSCCLQQELTLADNTSALLEAIELANFAIKSKTRKKGH